MKLAENASPEVKKALLAQIAKNNRGANPVASGRAAPGIRMPRPKGMSRPEFDYGELLKKEFASHDVRNGAFSFRLASGCLYTPDWCVWQGPTLKLVVECKGHFRLASAGRSNLAFKTAVAEWPSLAFRYAKQNKDGTWTITES